MIDLALLEYMEIFAEGMREHLEVLDRSLLEMEENINQRGYLDQAFRAVHTLKGMAGSMGFENITSLTHALEDVLSDIREGWVAISPKLMNLLFIGRDFLEISLQSIIDNGNEEDVTVDQVLNKIHALIESRKTKDKETLRLENQHRELSSVDPPLTRMPKSPLTLVLPASGRMPGSRKIPNTLEIEWDVLVALIKEIRDQNHRIQNLFVNLNDPARLTANQYILFYAFHTVKSMADFAELKLIRSIAQRVETFLDECRRHDRIATMDELNDLVRSSGFIRELCENPHLDSDPTMRVKVEQHLVRFGKSYLSEDGGSPGIRQPTQDPSSPSRSSSDSASVRIPAAKVDALVDMLGELLITQSLVEQETAHRFDRNDPLVNHLMRMGRLTRDIQYRAMALRMISLKPTFQKVARVGRDAINRLQKDVALTFAGEETEIDRSVAEKMIDPLLHLVKNSVSHGIEDDPARRQAQGKPPTGQVRVAAESRRGSVYITVADDGRGIDLAKVQQRAQERGLIDPSASPSDEEILDCLFQPGFSTAEQVTSVSGRGVGLDVVKTEIARLGGRVELANHPGEGSTFTLKIPINLAVLNGTVVEIAGSAYILPTVNVQKIVHGAESAQGTIRNQAAYVRVREHLVPLVSLARLLGITQPPAESPLFIVLELENRTRALPVDRVIGRQEIVVKSLGTEFSHLSFVAGASILGDGQVALILDIEGLFREKVG